MLLSCHVRVLHLGQFDYLSVCLSIYENLSLLLFLYGTTEFSGLMDK